LRGIRKAFTVIQHELHGHMPEQDTRKWQASISLDPAAVRDAFGPIATDESPAQAWRTTLESLLVDPDAAFPTEV
jgi:hypothetical protein